MPVSLKLLKSNYCSLLLDITYSISILCNLNMESKQIKLKEIQIRYYPPGLNLRYTNLQQPIQLNTYPLGRILGKDLGIKEQKQLIDQYIQNDLIMQDKSLQSYKSQLEQAVQKIRDKYSKQHSNNLYKKIKRIKGHQQPLTNCCFNKDGSMFATGSYDRTCKVWKATTGELLYTLKGHKNAVFSLKYSKYVRDLLLTGSLDNTAKLWLKDKLMHSLIGHKAEITTVDFNPNGIYCISSSMDCTSIVWDCEKGKSVVKLIGHEGQVVSSCLNYEGDKLLSCSLDKTCRIWDLRSGVCCSVLEHSSEVNCGKFQFTGQLCASGSKDNICTLWDIRTGTQLKKYEDNSGQIVDLQFSIDGGMLVTASVDSSVLVYNTDTLEKINKLEGHQGGVNLVRINPSGKFVMSCGADGLGRIWECSSGKNTQVLEGHEDEIYSGDISYFSNNIITASKDNTVILWGQSQK